MLNYIALAELGRQRRCDVARDVALCHHARSPRVVVGRLLVALGAFAVVVGSTLDEDNERKPEIKVA